RLGHDVIAARYGNLFHMYQKITGEDPYRTPMRIFPAPHYTMGGLWVDYNLMSNIPGLFVVGEANFSDHGANRLGASALMQGLADGYFVLPYTIGDYFARTKPQRLDTTHQSFREVTQEVEDRIGRLLAVNGKTPADAFHRELGTIMWNYCGMARNDAGLRKALQEIPQLRERFWREVKVHGTNEEYNIALERAGRVADFLEFAELMCLDALVREESCGGHFREESQTSEGEAQRDDERFSFVSAWEFNGLDTTPTLHQEPLHFENVELAVRSYK
ncbi:MAG: FAD-binding protein, partial [Bdellovibrionales bacterium]|nr:FAD-binding protein [Bdellovibrionales bacterium]